MYDTNELTPNQHHVGIGSSYVSQGFRLLNL